MGFWSLIILGIAILCIFICTSKYKINAFLVLIFVAFFFGIMIGIPLERLIDDIKKGFGDMFYKTGLIYSSGIIIGVILEKTGAAYSISRFIFKVTGEKRIGIVAAVSGYFVSVPINCDSGFIILFPMCKALASYAGVSLLAVSIALACGLLATHTLVPPTAGPTSVATMLGADMGQVIFLSLIIAGISISIGLFILKKTSFLTHFINKEFANRDNMVQQVSDLKLPNPFHSFLPILYPLVVICLNTVANLKFRPFGEGKVKFAISILGDPTVALLCAMLLSFTLIPHDKFKIALNEWIDDALKEAATIVLINSAAGAFAEVISDSPLIEQLSALKNCIPIEVGLVAPFLVAVVFKTAQGSSTVAMIATAGIMSPLISTFNLNPVFCVLAIGAGAMLFSHTNDSFFWVVAQFTKIDVKDMLKYYTISSSFIGVTVFILILITQYIVNILGLI